MNLLSCEHKDYLREVRLVDMGMLLSEKYIVTASSEIFVSICGISNGIELELNLAYLS